MKERSSALPTHVKDPLSGFEYPELWVAGCQKPGLLSLVVKGLAVLTSDGTVLLRGYTTGTTAAAACKGAVLSLEGPVKSVQIMTPSGIDVDVPVSIISPGTASCRKFAGDYPGDVTAGIEFIATASASPEGIVLQVGPGIGRFSCDTPRHAKGEPAIGGPSMTCIIRSISEALGPAHLSGVSIALRVPEGEKVAKKTLNQRLGILGGISVLGTTGLVEPWDDHLEEAVLSRISKAPRVVMSTGRIGLHYSRLLFPHYESVLIGSRIEASIRSVKGEMILCGLPGLILRYIEPGILEGTGCRTVEELMGKPGSDERVLHALSLFRERYPSLRIVLIDRTGAVTHDTR